MAIHMVSRSNCTGAAARDVRYLQDCQPSWARCPSFLALQAGKTWNLLLWDLFLNLTLAFTEHPTQIERPCWASSEYEHSDRKTIKNQNHPALYIECSRITDPKFANLANTFLGGGLLWNGSASFILFHLAFSKPCKLEESFILIANTCLIAHRLSMLSGPFCWHARGLI